MAFTVKSEHRDSQYEMLPGPVLSMRRSVTYETETTQHVAYCMGWCFFSNSSPDVEVGDISVRVNGEWYSPERNSIVFIPPFSIVEWRFQPKTIQFQMHYLLKALPEGWPTEPLVLASSVVLEPKNLEAQMGGLFKTAEWKTIGREAKACPITRKTKAAIIETFQDAEFDIAHLAEKLGYNHTVMSRLFKECYGITPVQYRNLLRVMRAQELLIFEKLPVTNVAGTVGFEGLSTFFRNFKNHTEAKPSAYLADDEEMPFTD